MHLPAAAPPRWHCRTGDGFAFTENIRGSEQWSDLPVVLVTARSTDHDRVRGMEAGANAYLVKSAFDQKSLLDSISQLI